MTVEDAIKRLETELRRVDDENSHYRHEARAEMQRLYIEMIELKGAMNPLLPLQIEVAALKQARAQAEASVGVVAWLGRGIAALALVIIGAVVGAWVRNRG